MVSQYISGGQVLHTLERAMGEARRREGELRAGLDQLDRLVEDVVARRGHSLVELAQHYLPDMSRESVARQFAEVRGSLENLLRKKQEHERRLQQTWDANLDRRSETENRLHEVTARLDELTTHRDALQQQLAQKLLAHGEFQEMSQQAFAAEDELKKNEWRVAEIREEAAEKLPAYEKSGLFQYLRRRGYGTPKYQGRGLTGQLDRWVARLVHYHENRQSYDFLRVTPELMAAEVDRRRDEFNELMEQIEGMEDAESDAIGLTAVLQQGSDLGKERAALLGDLDALESERRTMEMELHRLELTENEFYAAGIERLHRFLGSMEESALEARTRSTPQTTDDTIFRAIQECNEQLREAKRRSHEDRRAVELWQGKVSGLDDVVRRFRWREFDSRRSLFPGQFDIGREVNRYLEGTQSAEELWQQICRHQQFAPHWDDDSGDGWGGIFDSDVSHVLGRVLLEVAGEAMRQSARRGMQRRGPFRQQTRYQQGRPPYQRRGGFTSGRGF